jgi:hypothetical protein
LARLVLEQVWLAEALHYQRLLAGVVVVVAQQSLALVERQQVALSTYEAQMVLVQARLVAGGLSGVQVAILQDLMALVGRMETAALERASMASL